MEGRCWRRGSKGHECCLRMTQVDCMRLCLMRFPLFCSVLYGVFTSPAAAVQTPAAVRAERRPAEP